MKIKETTKRTDFDKLCKERNAAQVMRDDLCFLMGWIKTDCPKAHHVIDTILKAHEENREQEWL